tara:strand:- start:324 stop:902 length:579 start_codon:yes stop_codon:yes gene_type:complete
MPRGKGTYGSKVGRPKKKKMKKMMGGGSSKAAKPTAKSVYKKGGAKKKKLKKYQTAGPKTEFMDAVSNVNFVPFRSESDKFATELDQLGSVDRQIIDSMMQNKVDNRNAEMLAAARKEAARQKQLALEQMDQRVNESFDADLNKRWKEMNIPAFGTETNPIPLDEVTIPGNRKTGGSVINGKSLRSTRSYKR